MNVEQQFKIIEAYKNRTDICFCAIDKDIKGVLLPKQDHVFSFSEYKYEIVQTAPEALYLHVGKSCIYDNDAQHITTTQEHKALEKYVRVNEGNVRYSVVGKIDGYSRMFDMSFESAEKFITDNGALEELVIQKWVKV